MHSQIRHWIAETREKLKHKTLEDQDLDRLEALLEDPPRPIIMYLTARSTNMRSGIVGWVLFDPWTEQKPTLPSNEPPYKSVLEAIADGWHVVQYPIPKLYEYKDLENDYIGFDFILEKWY